MTTDEEINFGSMVTSPSSFNLDFEQDKELPALNCVDLFPNPPRLIENDEVLSVAVEHQVGQNDFSNDASKPQQLILDDDQAFVDKYIDENSTSNLENLVSELEAENLKTPETQEENHLNQQVTESLPDHPIIPSTACDNSILEEAPVDDRKTPNKTRLPVVSPALSLSSYYSSAESVSSSTSSTKKKKRKRHCYTCNLHFHHTYDLLQHLRVHVSLPTVQVPPLSEDNEQLQEFRERQKHRVAYEREFLNAQGDQGQNECGSLKLKFKLSGSQSFQVVPISRLTDDRPPKKGVRILTAQEIKRSPPTSPACGPLDAMVALSEMHLKQQQQDENSMDNKYFECPTLDGLDQYAEEVNNEAAEELLKKLLEGGQNIPQENDWASNTNEFMSIDRLAYMCTVCNSNFPDAVRLYEHKRITGHDFHHPMQPPPPPMPHMGMPNQFRPRHTFQQPHPPLPGYQPPCGPPMNMRPNFQGYPQRFPVLGPNFGQPHQTVARRPPPLYRVPNPQNTHPVNMAPFAEMNPEMYIPSGNGGIMINGQHFQPNQPHMVRQPVFLKARLQRATRPRTPGMHDRSPNGTPSPPVVLSQQLATRPRFLGPMPGPMTGPPIKRIKREVGSDDCEIVSSQPRMDGLPIIQSVQGGAITPPECDRSKDPIQLNDQITLSLKNKEQNKNPKEVANILANRGIIVTHKPKPPSAQSRESSPKSVTQEAVQKLQLNNSVSIISKKKPTDGLEEFPKSRTSESAFISCPVAECEEKFLTQEGLNRHTQRGHKMGKMNLKAFKCKLCPAMFSTQEGLIDHQRKNHRILKTSADELGIPIIDLRNEQTKQKLAQLGIINYIPLNAKSTNGCFGFPIVSVQGAANPNICNMLGMGVSSLLSLGPIKQIPSRKME